MKTTRVYGKPKPGPLSSNQHASMVPITSQDPSISPTPMKTSAQSLNSGLLLATDQVDRLLRPQTSNPTTGDLLTPQSVWQDVPLPGKRRERSAEDESDDRSRRRRRFRSATSIPGLLSTNEDRDSTPDTIQENFSSSISDADFLQVIIPASSNAPTAHSIHENRVRDTVPTAVHDLISASPPGTVPFTDNPASALSTNAKLLQNETYAVGSTPYRTTSYGLQDRALPPNATSWYMPALDDDVQTLNDNDSYSLASSDEADMAQIMTQMEPLPSVDLPLATTSQVTTVYDDRLQECSSSHIPKKCPGHDSNDEDLVDSEVDWSAVVEDITLR